MKQLLIAAFLLVASVTAAVAQEERAPEALFESAQCLVNDAHHWVSVEGIKQLELSYLTESKTFGGHKYIYVVVWDSPKHQQGTIYDVRLLSGEHRGGYSVENNAQFTYNKEKDEVSFLEPPLGGEFRQHQLTTTILKIAHRKKWYEAQVKQLLHPSPKLHCETNVEDVVPAKSAATPAKE
ncbi:MAG: hypothetical protein P4M01_09220 [Acidobacteriota bacterium]|nr:hypothetical protein [Acidobacteriota bacterium]